VLRRRLRQFLDADRYHASRDDMDPERYAGLQQAGFTLRASANGYTSVSKGITLTAKTGDQQ
jgi:hypothetical protein